MHVLIKPLLKGGTSNTVAYSKATVDDVSFSGWFGRNRNKNDAQDDRFESNATPSQELVPVADDRKKRFRPLRRLKNGAIHVKEEELKSTRGWMEDTMWGSSAFLLGLTPLMSVAAPLVPLTFLTSFTVRSVSDFIVGVARNPEENYADWKTEKLTKQTKKRERPVHWSQLRLSSELSAKDRIKKANKQVVQEEFKNPRGYMEDGFWGGYALLSTLTLPQVPLAMGLSFLIRTSAEFIVGVFQKTPEDKILELEKNTTAAIEAAKEDND